MREQLENRLQELRAEFEVGQKVIGELELRQANLRSTLLRIGGAIQVIEELLGKGKASAGEEPSALRAEPANAASQ
jgi:hypothetical protein